MKGYIKGVITGLLIGAVVSAIPAVAENIDALFNKVRINVNGVDEIQWGENIDLGEGETAPASILYNGTTYLPMRKLGELSGQQIFWNGDSKTVSMTGKQKDVKTVTEKPDKNGNVWTYYTFKDDNDNDYLGVNDKTRGYERIYKISGNIEITDNEIFFIRVGGESSPLPSANYGKIVRLPFDNEVDTQDGEIIKNISSLRNGGITDGYAYYVENIPGNASHSELWIYNLHSGEATYYKGNLWTTMSIINTNNNENNIVFKYRARAMQTNPATYEGEIVFDKTTNTFEKSAERVNLGGAG